MSGDRRVETVMALAVAWLAWHGHKPDELAARALDAATKVRALAERLEQMGVEQVRRVMQCKAPMQPCDCMYCEDQKRERAREQKRAEKPS